MRRSLLAFVLAAALFPAGAEARALYVTNFVSDNVSRLNVAADGSLSAPIAPFAPLPDPVALAFSPNGRALLGATATNPGAAQGFSVAASGAATAAGAPVGSGGGPTGTAVTPDGRFAFVSNSQGGMGNQIISRYSIAANGALTSLGAPTTAGGINLGQVAVTRDGRFVYVVSNSSPNNVFGFRTDSGGDLTPLTGSPFNVGATSAATIATSPDGRFVFVGDQNSHRLTVSAIAPNGALAPAAPPAPYGEDGQAPVDIAVSPDGRFVFQANFGDLAPVVIPSVINVFRVAASGALSEVAGSPFDVSGRLAGVSITPDGRRLYALYQGSADNIDGFSVSPAGALAPLPGSPYPSGGNTTGFSLDQPLAISPNQGPRAAPLIASRRSRTRTVDFTAAGASDPDGSVARWVWTFGDGQTASTTSPSVTHTYARDGAYVPSVTVVDDEGCSTALVHTGKQALCNGSPAATAVGVVPAFDATGPVISGFKIAKRRRSRSKATFRLSEAAILTAKLERRLSGRRVSGRCRKPTRKNRKRRKCARYRSLGSVTRTGKAGSNSLTIGKRFRNRRLVPGTYRLTLTARDKAGNVSRLVRKSFRVPKAKRKKR